MIDFSQFTPEELEAMSKGNLPDTITPAPPEVDFSQFTENELAHMARGHMPIDEPIKEGPASFSELGLRAIDEAQIPLYGALRGAGNLIGSDWLEQAGKEGVERNIQEAEQDVASERLKKWEDVNDISSFGRYLYEQGIVNSPAIGADLAATMIGTAIGGPVGAMALPAAVSFPQYYGQFINRQVQEQGDITNQGAAAATAALAALSEGATPLIPIGPILKGPLRKTTEGVAKAVEESGFFAKKAAINNAIERNLAARTLARGLEKGATEAGQEVFTTGLERYQADLPLTDEEARQEYIQGAATAGALAGVIGGGAGAIKGPQIDIRDPKIQEIFARAQRGETDEEVRGLLNTIYGNRAPELAPPPPPAPGAPPTGDAALSFITENADGLPKARAVLDANVTAAKKIDFLRKYAASDDFKRDYENLMSGRRRQQAVTEEIARTAGEDVAGITPEVAAPENPLDEMGTRRIIDWAKANAGTMPGLDRIVGMNIPNSQKYKLVQNFINDLRSRYMAEVAAGRGNDAIRAPNMEGVPASVAGAENPLEGMGAKEIINWAKQNVGSMPGLDRILKMRIPNGKKYKLIENLVNEARERPQVAATFPEPEVRQYIVNNPQNFESIQNILRADVSPEEKFRQLQEHARSPEFEDVLSQARQMMDADRRRAAEQARAEETMQAARESVIPEEEVQTAAEQTAAAAQQLRPDNFPERAARFRELESFVLSLENGQQPAMFRVQEILGDVTPQEARKALDPFVDRGVLRRVKGEYKRVGQAAQAGPENLRRPGRTAAPEEPVTIQPPFEGEAGPEATGLPLRPRTRPVRDRAGRFDTIEAATEAGPENLRRFPEEERSIFLGEEGDEAARRRRRRPKTEVEPEVVQETEEQRAEREQRLNEAQTRLKEIIEDMRKRGPAGRKAADAFEALLRDRRFGETEAYHAYLMSDIISHLFKGTRAEPDIQFVNQLLIDGEISAGGRRAPKTGRNGLIALSLTKDAFGISRETAAHEAFHALQDMIEEFDPKAARVLFGKRIGTNEIGRGIYEGGIFRDGMTLDDLPKGVISFLQQNSPDGEATYWQRLKDFEAGRVGDTVDPRYAEAAKGELAKQREMMAYVFGALSDAHLRGQSLGPVPGLIKRIAIAIANFRERMGNFLRGEGYNSAQDVLHDYAMGRRQQGYGAEPIRERATGTTTPSQPAQATANLRPSSRPGFFSMKYESSVRDPATGKYSSRPDYADIIDHEDRKIVVVDVNGVKVPFYLSTGKAGKTAPSGKWYPFFGIGRDRGWINKTGSFDMVNYYGSPALRRAAEMLDKTIGDIRNDTSVPKVSYDDAHFFDAIRDALGFEGVDNDPGNGQQLHANIKRVVDAVEGSRGAPIEPSFAMDRAKGFPKKARDTAEAMEAEGRNADDIFLATGLHRGDIDGKWRFEIPDETATLKLENLASTGTVGGARLGDIFDHPKIFRAYPELADVKVKARISPEWGASFIPENKSIEIGYKEIKFAHHADLVKQEYGYDPVASLKKTILHEATHWIQDKEEAHGGANIQSPATMLYDNFFNAIANRKAGLRKRYDDFSSAFAQKMRDDEGFRKRVEIKVKYLIRQTGHELDDLSRTKDSVLLLPPRNYEGIISTDKLIKDMKSDEDLAPVGKIMEAEQDIEDLSKKVVDAINENRDIYNRGTTNADARAVYYASPGEREPRDVEERMNMTPKERRAVRPGQRDLIGNDYEFDFYAGLPREVMNDYGPNNPFKLAEKKMDKAIAELGGKATELGPETEASLIGQRRGKIDPDDLREAEEMEARGGDPDAIWMRTGLARGDLDGKWRKEVPDDVSRVDFQAMQAVAHNRPMRLRDVYHHPDLFALYPEMENLDIKLLPGRDYGGSYDGQTGTIFLGRGSILDADPRKQNAAAQNALHSTLLHEGQHHIQLIEGFHYGSSPETSKYDSQRQIRKIIDDRIGRARHNAKLAIRIMRDRLEGDPELTAKVNAALDEELKASGAPKNLHIARYNNVPVIPFQVVTNSGDEDGHWTNVLVRRMAFNPTLEDISDLSSAVNEIESLRREMIYAVDDNLLAIANTNEDLYATYLGNAGEREPRDVQGRAGLSREELRRRRPGQNDIAAGKRQIDIANGVVREILNDRGPKSRLVKAENILRRLAQEPEVEASIMMGVTNRDGSPVETSRKISRSPQQLSLDVRQMAKEMERIREDGGRGLFTLRKMTRRLLDLNNRIFDPKGKMAYADVYRAFKNKTIGDISLLEKGAKELYDALDAATPQQRKAIYNYLTTKGANAPSLPPELAKAAVAAKRRVMEIGRELVDKGILSDKTVASREGEYLPRLYLKYMLQSTGYGTGTLRAGKMGWAMKLNEDLDKDIRAAYGEIKDPALLSLAATAFPARDMAVFDFLKQIATATGADWVLPRSLVDWRGNKVTPFWLMSEAAEIRQRALLEKDPQAKATMKKMAAEMQDLADRSGMKDKLPEDYRQLPDTKRYGVLRGMAVRKEIYDDVVGMGTYTGDPDGFQKIFGDKNSVISKGVQYWKLSKTVYNLPAHIRQFFSNGVVLNLSGVPAPMVPVRVLQAINAIKNKNEYWQLAERNGVSGTGMVDQELRTALEEIEKAVKGSGDGPFNLPLLRKAMEKLALGPAKLYQLNDTLFKVAKIIDVMETQKKKLGAGAPGSENMRLREAVAAQEAHKWFMDYSDVQPWIRTARSSPLGMPFITYQWKIAPLLIETLLTQPWRFLPYVGLYFAAPAVAVGALGLKDDDDLEKLKKSTLDFLKNNPGALPLPSRDEKGRFQFVDIGYIFPWSYFTNIATTTKNFAQGEAKLSDLLKAGSVFSSPVLTTPAALLTNVDTFTGKPIYNEYDTTDQKAKEWMGYVWGQLAPPIITNHGAIGKPLGDYIFGGGEMVDRKGNPRETTGQLVARGLGFNVYPVDPAVQRQYNMSKMKYDINQTKARRTYALRDRSLSPEQRAKLRDDFNEEIRAKIRKLQEYAKATQLNERLRVK